MENDMSKILNELKEIRIDINFIKNNMVDPDCILTEDDLESIEEAEREYKEGKTISHEQLKKELGLKCSK